MKLGTENRNKTIVATVLLGLALILVARWLFTSDSSTTAASPAPVRSNPRTASEPTPDNAPAPNRQASRKSDQKYMTAVFKPSLDPSLNLQTLQKSESIEYKGTNRNIFGMTEEPEQKIPVPIQGPRNAAPPQKQVNLGPPPPPPINLKFYGFSTKSGQKTVFLSQDKDTVFVAHEGDIVGRRYKVLRINPNSVEIMDLLTNNKQTISLTS